MKYIKFLIVIGMYLSHIMVADQLPQEHDESIKEMMREGCAIIDSIFSQAHASITAKEDILHPEWFKNRTEMCDLQNLMSDACITFTFDQNIKNPLPELLQEYVQNKIRDESSKLFTVYKVSVKDVENFYELSHIVCKLSQGNYCGRMVRAIEDEYFHEVLMLKMQKTARKHLRKQEIRELREALVFGTR